MPRLKAEVTLNKRSGLVAQETNAAETCLKLAESKASFFEVQCDEYKRQAEDQKEELVNLRKKFESLQGQHGRFRIQQCGLRTYPIGLSVAFQFIVPGDSGLAKRIRDLFYTMSPIWDRKPIKHISWRQNPSSKTRIVIFSDHECSPGIESAFNECCLLEEGVDRRSKEPHMSEDVTIIVFNEDN